eukprot:scaffold970_cov412-Prasinococcus_capsulatus_cf.AAC.4
MQSRAAACCAPASGHMAATAALHGEARKVNVQVVRILLAHEAVITAREARFFDVPLQSSRGNLRSCGESEMCPSYCPPPCLEGTPARCPVHADSGLLLAVRCLPAKLQRQDFYSALEKRC